MEKIKTLISGKNIMAIILWGRKRIISTEFLVPKTTI